MRKFSAKEYHAARAVLQIEPDRPDEIWKFVPAWNNYQASTKGRVRRIRPGQGTQAGRFIMPNCNGYITLNRVSEIGRGQITWRVSLPDLILYTFEGLPPTPLHRPCFKDGKPYNCFADNLYWGNSSTYYIRRKMCKITKAEKLNEANTPDRRKVGRQGGLPDEHTEVYIRLLAVLPAYQEIGVTSAVVSGYYTSRYEVEISKGTVHRMLNNLLKWGKVVTSNAYEHRGRLDTLAKNPVPFTVEDVGKGRPSLLWRRASYSWGVLSDFSEVFPSEDEDGESGNEDDYAETEVFVQQVADRVVGRAEPAKGTRFKASDYRFKRKHVSVQSDD